MVVTLRETEQINKLKQFIDAEVEIRGFDKNNVEKYISYCFRDYEKARGLMKQAEQAGLITKNHLNEQNNCDEILCVPFLLNMICTLFFYNQTLPKTKTEIEPGIEPRTSQFVILH